MVRHLLAIASFFIFTLNSFANTASLWEGEWSFPVTGQNGITIRNCKNTPSLQCEVSWNSYDKEFFTATESEGKLYIPLKDYNGKVLCEAKASWAGKNTLSLEVYGEDCQYFGFSGGIYSSVKVSQEPFLYEGYKRQICFSDHKAAVHWCSNKGIFSLAETIEEYEQTLKTYFALQKDRKFPLDWKASEEEKGLKKEKELWVSETFKKCSSDTKKIVNCLAEKSKKRLSELKKRIDEKIDRTYLKEETAKKSYIFQNLYPDGDFYTRKTGWQCQRPEGFSYSKGLHDEFERVSVFDIKELNSLPGHFILLRVTMCGMYKQAFFSIWKKEDLFKEYTILDEVRVPGTMGRNPYELSEYGSLFQNAYLDLLEFPISSEEKAFGYRVFSSGGGSGLSHKGEFLTLFHLEENSLKKIFKERLLYSHKGICVDDDCDSYKSIILTGNDLVNDHFEWTVKRNYTFSEESLSKVVQKFTWNGKKYALSSEKKYYKTEKP